jgi:hypothetical protein
VTRHRSEPADAVELDADYPMEFLDCREERHWWLKLGRYHANGEIVTVRICKRCDMERRDYWSPRGYRLRPSRYTQPDGYKISGGATAQAIREAVLERTTVFDTEAAMHAALNVPTSKKKSAS